MQQHYTGSAGRSITMKYLPYENFMLTTPLTESQVEIRINNLIEPRKRMRMRSVFMQPRSKPYEGELHGNRFSIRKIISYRNSFLPEIEGNIWYAENKTSIHVRMRLNPFSMVFMCIWMGGVFLAFIIMIVASLVAWEFNIGILLTLMMFLMGYGLTLGAFKAESLKSKKDLAEWLVAEINEL